MVHRLDTRTCLYGDCIQPSVPGAEYGFRFCKKHLRAAGYMVPTPPGFEYDPPPQKPKREYLKPQVQPPMSGRQYDTRREEVYAAMIAMPHVADQWFVHHFDVPQQTISRLRRYLHQEDRIPQIHFTARIPHPTEEDLMKFTKVDRVPVANGAPLRPEDKEIAEHCTKHPGESFQLDPAEALSPAAMESKTVFRQQGNKLRHSLKAYVKREGLPHIFTVNLDSERKTLYVTYAKKEAAA
ncbi:hypothetical protein [uncultured Corynebacterium sp.]|uniref:hypothetical protein n=1 Tax=uncultured Corynebacterium sp. TaxID=159447 RepID=UPI0025943C92|nr:hypothetical protein [uncultured Corynebacterium sp.]